jgi:hypothetical protein
MVQIMCAKKQEKGLKNNSHGSNVKHQRASTPPINADNKKKWETEIAFFQKIKP